MKPLQAFCESADESSDEGRPTKPTQLRSRSNVAVKRSSQSSDLGRANAAASDSGYSSRTAATKSSADSAKSSSDRRGSPVKTEAPPAVPDAPTPTKPRPKQPESSSRKSTHGRESSKSSKTTKASKSSKATKPVIRQNSTREKALSTSRPRRESINEDCNDPHCTECKTRARARPLSLNTGIDPNYPSYAPQSPRVPSSPMRASYGHEYPSVQTQVASSTRPKFYPGDRRTTYHGGSALLDRYNNLPQLSNHYGPPPSMYHPHYPPMMGNTPPTGYYNPIPPSPLGTSFDRRPQLPGRGLSDGYTSRPPLQSLPNPRYQTAGPLIASTREQDDDQYSEEEDEDGYYRQDPAEHARRVMPPPALPQRPSLRSHTTTDVRRSRAASIGYGNRENDYENDMSAALTRSLQFQPQLQSSRGSSVTGPRTHYYAPSSRGDGVLIEPARSDRPRESERERLRRNTNYNKNVVPRLRLDDAFTREARANEKKKNKLDSKMNMVEAYLNTTTGSSYGPGVDNLRTKSSRDRAPSNGARTRTSSNSQHSRDDASRISDGSHSTSTRKTTKDGNLTVRVDGDDVKIEGDMEGKTFRITNGDSGNQQITIIADPRGRENKYLMEGSRVTTNTSSSRSRSEREVVRPRAFSRFEYERALERQQHALKRARRVSYVDDPERQW